MRPPRSVRGMTLAVLLATGSPAHAGSIGLPEIVTQTVGALPACLDWRPVGACFWLDGCPLHCHIEVSIKIAHQMADLVVPVFNDLAEHPITGLGSALSPLQARAARGIVAALSGGALDRIGSQGGRTEDPVTSVDEEVWDRRNLFFREADAIGNPTAVLLGASVDPSSLVGADLSRLAGLVGLDVPGVTSGIGAGTRLGGLLCPAVATVPLFPHYQSALDALVWRNFVPAEAIYPATFIPGLREVGSWPGNTWGNVHPRIGFLTHAVDPKAAAVLAQRAGDIVTRADQPHVYFATEQGVTTAGGYRVWLPPPLVEGDAETGTWQMLVPVPENECQVFGENDVLALPGAAWADGKVDPGGDYVWNLWRRYACCEDRGIFLFAIDF